MARTGSDPSLKPLVVLGLVAHLTTEVTDDEPCYQGLLVHNLSFILSLTQFLGKSILNWQILFKKSFKLNRKY